MKNNPKFHVIPSKKKPTFEELLKNNPELKDKIQHCEPDMRTNIPEIRSNGVYSQYGHSQKKPNFSK